MHFQVYRIRHTYVCIFVNLLLHKAREFLVMYVLQTVPYISYIKLTRRFRSKQLIQLTILKIKKNLRIYL